MNRLTIFIGILLTYSNLCAQKKVEVTKPTNNIQQIQLHLDFANQIELKNWDKNEIHIEATIDINDNQDNDLYQLKTDLENGILQVKSDYKAYFDKQKKRRSGICDHCSNCISHEEVKANYKVYLPKKMHTKIKSISGSVEVLSHAGNLNVDLVSGDINIRKSSENMHLKTVSGEIDIFIANAKFKAQTVTGNVYSDLDIAFEDRARGVGSKITGTVASGKNDISLSSVSGNIFLRKPKL